MKGNGPLTKRLVRMGVQFIKSADASMRKSWPSTPVALSRKLPSPRRPEPTRSKLGGGRMNETVTTAEELFQPSSSVAWEEKKKVPGVVVVKRMVKGKEG